MGQEPDRTLSEIEEIRSRLRHNTTELRKRVRRPAVALGGIGAVAALAAGALAMRRFARRRAEAQRVVVVPESAAGGGGTWAKAAAVMAAASLALTVVQLRRKRSPS